MKNKRPNIETEFAISNIWKEALTYFWAAVPNRRSSI